MIEIRGIPALNDPTDGDRLKALEERIRQAKGTGQVRHHTEDHHSQAQLAWRMVIELVAGLGIGFGAGYGLDVLLGTTPWLMVLFIFLGLAAGVKTMMRSAAEFQTGQTAREEGQDGDDGRGD